MMDARLARRTLSYVNLYCNNLCNSRCTTCDFWKMDPHVRLDPASLRSVVESRFADEQTWFALQGGEFSLHPEAHAILDLLSDRRYILFTNLLSFDRVRALVRRHGTRYVTVSLDGGREGYARIRGVDGFDRVTRGILALREHATVSVGFTLTPWTTLQDYRLVAAFCRAHALDFGVSMYTDSHIYQATVRPADYPFIDAIVEDEGHDFAAAYRPWLNGVLQLPCHGVREVASISPDGTVHLCHNQPVALGNITESSFDDIWGSDATRGLHDRFSSCNACWTSCYRQFDLERARRVEAR